MGNISRHPLFQASDALKRALVLSGFTIYADGTTNEVIESCQETHLFAYPDQIAVQEMGIAEPGYSLRTQMLGPSLPAMAALGTTRAVEFGRIFDAASEARFARLRAEGFICEADFTDADMLQLWQNVAREIYGLDANATLEESGKDTWIIKVSTCEGNEIVLGGIGKGNWMAKQLFAAGSPCDTDTELWLFSLDADNLAEAALEGGRSALYSIPEAATRTCDCNAPAYPTGMLAAITDSLRKLGYREYVGLKAYEDDAYTKMNMFQGKWDLNNQPIKLEKAIGNCTGLPTVLVPGLEEAMGDCYRAGIPNVRLFEIAHIFLPGRKGNAPTEKIAITMGGYGDGLDIKQFKEEVGKFLDGIEFQNHYYIPTDVPIPYRTGECHLLFNERMEYMEANFGGTCDLAENNHGVGEHMFISQFELDPLIRQAAREHDFVPNEDI